MVTNECWFGMHDRCLVSEYCECLCHVEPDSLFEELDDILEDQ